MVLMHMDSVVECHRKTIKTVRNNIKVISKAYVYVSEMLTYQSIFLSDFIVCIIICIDFRYGRKEGGRDASIRLLVERIGCVSDLSP